MRLIYALVLLLLLKFASATESTLDPTESAFNEVTYEVAANTSKTTPDIFQTEMDREL